VNRNTEERTRLPEYQIDQHFPRQQDIIREERERLREQYGYLRAFFLARPEPFRNLSRWLNQARIDRTYDEYMARSVQYAAVAGVLGAVFGLFLAWLLASTGVLSTLESPIDSTGPVVLFVAENRLPVAVATLVPTLGGGSVAGLLAGRYYYPRMASDTRARSINLLLPHAIVYMYALSHGGMNTFDVVKETAKADDVYGDVARELDTIVRDVELFGNDLFTAIRDARNLTPSDNLEQFLDDLLSVLDSGSSVTAFLEAESETYMAEAREEQDDFLETLSILSEVFVVVFVAAPLFLIVTLMVISLLGGNSLYPTYLLVYVALPLGMVGFVVLLDLLSKPYAQGEGDIDLDEVTTIERTPDIESDPHFEEYERQQRFDRARNLLANPTRHLRGTNPLYTLALTVPIALLVVLLGLLDGGLSAISETPFSTTTVLFVGPFLIVAGPLALAYEVKRRRERRIASRFPDTLNILSSANQMGIRLTESLELVSRWSEGVLAAELRKVSNDITWNHDVERALLGFADRLGVPQVTRTMKLIARGSRSTSDLSQVLSIAAEDTRNRYKIESKRRRAMSSYIAIVVIGFLVYLAVIVMVDVGYLRPIAELAPEAGEVQGPLLDIGQVPVQAYRTTFFHSALIQGAGAGLLAGKLAENDVLAGLKYSVLLVALTMVVFALV